MRNVRLANGVVADFGQRYFYGVKGRLETDEWEGKGKHKQLSVKLAANGR